MLNGEAENTNIAVLGLTRLGFTQTLVMHVCLMGINILYKH